MVHQDTTVVFVPGAFHTPNCFDATIKHIHAAGYRTSKVETPSVLRNGAAPISNFDPDVAEIRKYIIAATDAGQKVILVMHSYGGIPGSEALRGLSQTTFTEQGHADGRGVIHAVYLAAYMLRAGETGLSATKGELDWILPQENGSFLPLNPADRFGYDFESQEEIDRWVADIKPFSIMAAASPLTYEPWRDIPSTYLTTENDKAVPVSWQREWIANALEAGAVDLRTVHWKTAHTPFGVDPLRVSQLIRRSVGDVAIVTAVEAKRADVVTTEAVEVEALV